MARERLLEQILGRARVGLGSPEILDQCCHPPSGLPATRLLWGTVRGSASSDGRQGSSPGARRGPIHNTLRHNHAAPQPLGQEEAAEDRRRAPGSGESRARRRLRHARRNADREPRGRGAAKGRLQDRHHGRQPLGRPGGPRGFCEDDRVAAGPQERRRLGETAARGRGFMWKSVSVASSGGS